MINNNEIAGKDQHPRITNINNNHCQFNFNQTNKNIHKGFKKLSYFIRRRQSTYGDN